MINHFKFKINNSNLKLIIHLQNLCLIKMVNLNLNLLMMMNLMMNLMMFHHLNSKICTMFWHTQMFLELRNLLQHSHLYKNQMEYFKIRAFLQMQIV